jgi:chorismate synthase
MPHEGRAGEALEIIERLKARGDSAGGKVTCLVEGLPPGLGSPVFQKLDALLAQAMLSLGAVKGVEFGAGFAAAELCGSENNDALLPGADTGGAGGPAPGVPPAVFETNRSGGVLGGLSNGSPLIFTLAVKPVPSIGKIQKTIDREGRARELTVRGRHDACVCPRMVPVVEAMTALVLADLLLLSRGDRA